MTGEGGDVRDVVPFRDAVRAWFVISLQTFGGPAGQIAVMQRELVEERRSIVTGEGGDVRDVVPFRDAVRAWFSISLQTFGGPAGQIAVMQRELVEERRWIGQRRFLHALSYCTLLPGPEAQQLAIYVGWLLNGVRGGLVAGVLFVLPGVAALLALSAIYVGYGDTTAVAAVFAGLAPAVLAVVAQAVVRIGKRALGHPALVALAVASFLALSLFNVPFPAVIAGAAVIGMALGRWAPATMAGPPAADEPEDGSAPLIPDDQLHVERPTRRHSVTVIGLGLVAWGVPLGAVALLTGTDSVFTEQGLFFSGAALVTFGGAYAVLAYVAQQAVEVYGWLAPGEMVRGLALAESTPGPLIMVVQFVAFVGAYRDPGSLDPWLAAVLGSAPDHLGHVRAVLRVHLPRCAVRRTAAREHAASRRR